MIWQRIFRAHEVTLHWAVSRLFDATRSAPISMFRPQWLFSFVEVFDRRLSVTAAEIMVLATKAIPR
jgi:hypothetical protein